MDGMKMPQQTEGWHKLIFLDVSMCNFFFIDLLPKPFDDFFTFITITQEIIVITTKIGKKKKKERKKKKNRIY